MVFDIFSDWLDEQCIFRNLLNGSPRILFRDACTTPKLTEVFFKKTLQRKQN